jgi:hypothetical protein
LRDERYFERREVKAAIAWAEEGGVAVHRNFDHYHGTRSARGFLMTRPFLHVIGLRAVLERWARAQGIPTQAIQPEKRRKVAHIDVFGEFALQLLTRVEPRVGAAASFELFTRVSSPLYSGLSARLLDDPELLELAAEAPVGQPPPNLLFAAVHFLLLQGVKHPLARLYPSLNGGRHVGEDPFPAFRDFCLSNRAAVVELIHSRRVQTNEAGRSSALQPAFAVVAARSGLPLSLVEIGSSAGLNLVGDRYRYSYGGPETGAHDSPVLIECRLRGELRPPTSIAPVAWRLGIDREPVDVSDPEQALWLRALVWPDQPWRAEILLHALEVARRDPPPLLRADALEVLPGVLAGVPDQAALCVFSSFTIYQFRPEQRERLEAQVEAAARSRPVYRVRLEWFPGEKPFLDLDQLEGDRRTHTRLAAAHDHGLWLEWLDADSAS